MEQGKRKGQYERNATIASFVFVALFLTILILILAA